MRKIITFLTETFFHFANLLNVAVWSINFSQTAVIASSKIEIYFYHKKWYFWVKSRYFMRKREMPELSNHFRGILILNFYFLKKSCWFSRHFFLENTRTNLLYWPSKANFARWQRVMHTTFFRRKTIQEL